MSKSEAEALQTMLNQAYNFYIDAVRLGLPLPTYSNDLVEALKEEIKQNGAPQ